MKKLTAILTVLCFLIYGSGTLAENRWYRFGTDNIPEELTYRVRDYSGKITVTFLGDCTLGGEDISLNNPKGFFKVIEAKGYDYPFRNLVRLTEKDDLTVANLEGVLSDRSLPKTEKVFNFKGPTAYTEILKAGSIECVTLANNHSGDYGRAGTEDTQKALDDADIAWLSTDRVTVCDVDGVLVGFAGINITLNGSAGKRYREQVEALKKAGCSAIVTLLHAGTEYDPTPNVYQKRMVKKAILYGSDLIVGHHPHVVQGYEITEHVPVVYSLGNCSFGGNTYPEDLDAVVLQADFEFEENELVDLKLRFYPIQISANRHSNDFSPILLEGSEAERVLDRMKKSTGYGFGTFDPIRGAEAIKNPE